MVQGSNQAGTLSSSLHFPQPLAPGLAIDVRVIGLNYYLIRELTAGI
jgi:hypothetical protein